MKHLTLWIFRIVLVLGLSLSAFGNEVKVIIDGKGYYIPYLYQEDQAQSKITYSDFYVKDYQKNLLSFDDVDSKILAKLYASSQALTELYSYDYYDALNEVSEVSYNAENKIKNISSTKSLRSLATNLTSATVTTAITIGATALACGTGAGCVLAPAILTTGAANLTDSLVAIAIDYKSIMNAEENAYLIWAQGEKYANMVTDPLTELENKYATYSQHSDSIDYDSLIDDYLKLVNNVSYAQRSIYWFSNVIMDDDGNFAGETFIQVAAEESTKLLTESLTKSVWGTSTYISFLKYISNNDNIDKDELATEIEKNMKKESGAFLNSIYFSSDNLAIYENYFDSLKENNANHRPTASFTFDKKSAKVGDTITVESNSTDPDGDPLTNTWFLYKPDGTHETINGQESISFIASQEGSYSIKLNVNDGQYSHNTQATIKVSSKNLSDSQSTVVVYINKDLNPSTITSYRWSKIDGKKTVYVIDNNFFIGSKATLTIDPGVIVKIKNSGYIDVRGVLKAVGTPNEKVVFTSLKDDDYGGDTNKDGSKTKPAKGDWSKISLSNADSVIENALIRYGGHYEKGLYVNASATIRNNIIEHIDGTGIFVYKDSPLIQNNTFRDMESGVESSSNATPVLSNNKFIDNYQQISVKNSTLDFGNIEVGSQETKSIVVSNIGKENSLEIYGITTQANTFKILTNGCKNVAPQNSCIIELAFSPIKEGVFQDTITIKSNSLTNQTLHIELKGSAKDTFVDSDQDGIADLDDAFPNDPAASVDSDGDGHPDKWNDGKTEADSTTGLTIDKYPLDSTKWQDTANYNFTYKIGWSLKALPVKTSINSSYLPNASIVWKYKDKWMAYSNNNTIKDKIVAKDIPTFTTINYGEGFWVYATGDSNITLNGVPYGINDINTANLSSGWYLLGVGKDTNASDIMSSIPNASIIWTYSEGKWNAYSNNSDIASKISEAGIKTIEKIKSGEGFWVYLGSFKENNSRAQKGIVHLNVKLPGDDGDWDFDYKFDDTSDGYKLVLNSKWTDLSLIFSNNEKKFEKDGNSIAISKIIFNSPEDFCISGDNWYVHTDDNKQCIVDSDPLELYIGSWQGQSKLYLVNDSSTYCIWQWDVVIDSSGNGTITSKLTDHQNDDGYCADSGYVQFGLKNITKDGFIGYLTTSSASIFGNTTEMQINKFGNSLSSSSIIDIEGYKAKRELSLTKQ